MHSETLEPSCSDAVDAVEALAMHRHGVIRSVPIGSFSSPVDDLTIRAFNDSVAE